MFGKIKKLLSGSSNIHSLIGNILYAAFSMVLFFMMVRMLNKDLYGRWIIFITAVSLLDMLRTGLTATGAIRAISTTKGEEQYSNIAATYRLSIYSTFILSLIFIPIYFLIKDFFLDSYYLPILLFYPFLAFANLAHMQAVTYCQGIVNFKRILVIRSSIGVLNLVFMGLYILLFDENLTGIIITYGLSDVIVSIFVIFTRWDGSRFFRYYKRENLTKILQFGKYSTASNIGSSLLRSSDTIIISLSSVMGAPAVAIYAIPLKFVEFVEIPLRSLTATAYPKLSAAYTESKEKFNEVFSLYISYSVVVLLPLLIIIPLSAGYILHFFGGKIYADSIDLQKTILYIIIGYIFTLPFDRYSGVALFAFDKPELNFKKIIVMLISNVAFDLVAVFIFHSLELVAVATVLFTIMGIVMGWRYIYKFSGLTLSFTLKQIFRTLGYILKSSTKLFKK